MTDNFQGVDPFDVLDDVLAQISLSADERKLVEEARAHFIRILQNFNDDDVIDALHAVCRYGMIVGHYIRVRDPATLTKIDSLRGAVAGKRSGEKRQKRPWHKHGIELAKEIRGSRPWFSQQSVAEEIISRWSSRNRCPSVETLEKFISALEQDGTMPRATKKK